MKYVKIRSNDCNHLDKLYIYNEMFVERLGIEIEVIWEKRNNIYLESKDGSAIELEDCFLNSEDLLKETESICSENRCSWLDPGKELNLNPVLLKDGKLPFITKKSYENVFEIVDKTIHYNADLLGGCYFLLNGCEEYIRNDYDKYGRLSAEGSFALKNEFLDIPIVDIYEMILVYLLNRIGIETTHCKAKEASRITCDIDVPYTSYRGSFKQLIRNLGGDLLVRKSPLTVIKRLVKHIPASMGFVQKELNFTFSWIMDVCEKYSLRATFFFMASPESEYQLNEKWVGELIETIDRRGHRLGIHPDRESFTNAEKMSNEVRSFRELLQRTGVKSAIGGRQHYLQIKIPDTLCLYEQNRIQFDSSLGFHDHFGFRTGTSRDYKIFDVINKRTINVQCEPLHLMEVTVLQYMNEPLEHIPQHVSLLNSRIKAVNGTFNVLWHNNMIITPRQKKVYKEMLDLLS